MKKMLLCVAAVLCAATMSAKDEPMLQLLEGNLDFWNETGKYATIDIDWSNATVVEWGKKNEVKEDFGTIEQYNKMKGEDYVNDWPGVKYAVTMSASTWGNYVHKKKGLKIITPQDESVVKAMATMTDEQKAELEAMQKKQEKSKLAPAVYMDADKADYDIVVRVDSIDMGNAAASVFKAAFGDAQYRGGCELVGTMEVRDHKTQAIVSKLKINHIKGLGSTAETARLGNVYFRLWNEVLPDLIKAESKK